MKLVTCNAVADPRGGGAGGPKSSQFNAVFQNIWQNHMLAPPPTGNHGSAPEMERTEHQSEVIYRIA